MSRRYRIEELLFVVDSWVAQFPDDTMHGALQTTYASRHVEIDWTVKNKYGHLKTLRRYDNVDEAIADMRHVFRQLMGYNYYKYGTLAKTEKFEYEPLWNVDGTTESVIERESTDTVNNGQVQTTVNNGQKQTTNTIGQRTNTDNIGATQFNRMNAVSPFETESIANVAHDEQIETTAQKQDTHILSSATDSQTQNASTDTQTVGAHTDTNENESKETTKVIRYGNIGITSSQTLVLQERDVAMFNVFEIVFSDFFDIFCLQIID